MSILKSGALKAGRPSDTKKAAMLSALADRAETVRVNFDLDRESHKRLKILAAEKERSVSDVLREAVAAVLGR